MTIADLIPALRPTGAHRAVDEVARLRGQLASADDFFESQNKLITDLEGDVRKWKSRAEIAERTVGQLEAVVRLRDQQIEDLARKVDIGVKAEHAVTETQPFAVLPLHQSPLADPASPAHVPSWADDTETQPLRAVGPAA
ncbi:hypothetical protein [Streptomyces sp. NBC_00356]|uniref:hypothetical protein n=1 Tax=Streptomyces sp. NBC_00356 TaxID=2975724 RepID=UPI002E27516F